MLPQKDDQARYYDQISECDGRAAPERERAEERAEESPENGPVLVFVIGGPHCFDIEVDAPDLHAESRREGRHIHGRFGDAVHHARYRHGRAQEQVNGEGQLREEPL